MNSASQNEIILPDKVEKVFRPGTGVYVALGMDTDIPLVRSSVVYEADYSSRQFIVAQTDPPLTPGMVAKKNMEITALLKESGHPPIRVGLSCRPINFLKTYDLAGGTKVQAWTLRYTGQIRQSNIRTSFRVPPNTKYEIDAVVEFDDITVKSGSDMFVYDISATGISFVFPKQVEAGRNMLLSLRPGQKVRAALVLRDFSSSYLSEYKVTLSAKMIRRNDNYADKKGFIAFQYEHLNMADENTIGMFVQNAQLFQIRKMDEIYPLIKKLKLSRPIESRDDLPQRRGGAEV